jgi:hypothetical protein
MEDSAISPMANAGIFRVMNRYSAVVSILIFLGCTGCNPDDNSESLDRSNTDVKYTVHHNWPSLPEGRTLGFVTAVELDSHGHIFTFHGFRNWVIPFPDEPEPDPTILMWSGEDGVEGWDDMRFAKPTDVEFGLDGSVYVSDGYENCRVINFTPGGQYRFEWGECGDAPSQFNTPHDLAIDRQGRVYVADRDNDRVQVFEPDGEFITEWQSGRKWRPYGLSISPTKEELFVVDGGEQPSSFPDRSGVVVLDLSGHQVAKFGRFGNQDGQFNMGHDIAVCQEGNVYVVDVIGRRLQRFSQAN